MTTIEDILTYAGGGLANGRVVVSWPPFQIDGTSVAGGMQTFEIVQGVFHVELYSNANAKPIGMYYTAAYELDEGAIYTEYWVIPNLQTVTLGQVLIAFPPTPSALISAAQLTSAGASYGMFLGWDGSHWVPMYTSMINVTPNTIGLNLTAAAAADLSMAGSPATLGQSMTLNIPDAGPAARGVVTVGGQSFSGPKTFQDPATFLNNVMMLGFVGVGRAPGAYRLEVAGDVNLSPGGAYRVNGVAIPAGHVIQDEGAALPQRTALSFVGADVAVTDDSANNRTVVTVTGTPSLVTSVFGRQGAVVAAVGDYAVGQVTGAVPATRQLIAGAGLSGGGTLAADRIFTVVDDTTTQRVRTLFNATLVGTRPALNFIAGANITLGVIDDSVNNRVDVTITAVGTGGATPSNYDVDGVLVGTRSTLNLISGTNVTLVGVDNAANDRVDITISTTGGGGNVASVFGRAGVVVAVAGDYTAAQVTNAVSVLGAYADPVWVTSLAWSKITGAPAAAVSSVFTRTGVVVAQAGDYTAAQVTNAVSTLGSYADPAWITSLAWSKITGAPAAAVSSVFTRTGAVVAQAGDYTAAQITNAVSVLGSYGDPVWITSLAWSKITGAPAAGSQTPWTSDIDGGGFTLKNVGKIGIGVAPPEATLDVLGSGIFRSTPQQNLSSGVGLRVGYESGGAGGADIMSRDWTAGTFKPLSIRGNPTTFTGGPVSIGTTSVNDPLVVSGISGTGGQLRLVYSSYGVIFRNDDSYLYIMNTNAGDPYGTWKSPIPLYFDLAGGTVIMGGSLVVNINASITGSVTASGGFTSTAHAIVRSNNVQSVYAAAALEINQTNLSGATDVTVAPRIAFHWTGVVASQIGMDSAGTIRTYDNPGTGYVNFACAALTATSWNGYSAPNGSPTVNHIAAYDANGYFNATWINTVSGDSGGAAITRIYASSDAFIRYYTLANFAAQLAPYVGGGVTTQNSLGNSGANTRFFNSIYRNTTGKPMFVNISASIPAGYQMAAVSDAGAAPGFIVAVQANPGTGYAYTNVSFWVLPLNYYSVQSNAITLQYWVEWY